MPLLSFQCSCYLQHFHRTPGLTKPWWKNGVLMNSSWQMRNATSFRVSVCVPVILVPLSWWRVDTTPRVWKQGRSSCFSFCKWRSWCPGRTSSTSQSAQEGPAVPRGGTKLGKWISLDGYMSILNTLFFFFFGDWVGQTSVRGVFYSLT